MVTKERMEQMLDRMAEAATGYLETDEGDRYRAKSIAEAKSEILGELFPDDSINGNNILDKSMPFQYYSGHEQGNN